MTLRQINSGNRAIGIDSPSRYIVDAGGRTFRSVETGFVGFIRREVVAAEIGDSQLAKDVVEDRGRACDSLVAFDEARGFEAGGREGVHEFLERDAVLQAKRLGADARVPDFAWATPVYVGWATFTCRPGVRFNAKKPPNPGVPPELSRRPGSTCYCRSRSIPRMSQVGR